MKLYDLGITIILVVVGAALIGTMSYRFLGPNNAIEEAAEAVIEVETGRDIDLSPEVKDAAKKG